MMFKESNLRSILKMISWRGSGTVVTMLIVYIFTRRVGVAAVVGGFEMVAKMILYYMHERVWDKIQVGRHEVKPFVLWLTGLHSSGKTVLGDKIYKILKKKRYRVEKLGGKDIRSLFPATGYSKEERNRHITRVGYLASMLEKNGVIVISSFVSPYKEARDFVRGLCVNFIEVYVATPLEECERRDKEGMYKKARAGEISNFTGVNAPYEAPEKPQVTIDLEKESADKAAGRIMEAIKKYL